MPLPADAKITGTWSRTPRRRRCSSARYMIFCGAPAHFTGVDGNVKIALPAVTWSRVCQVESTRS
jgi:hypothetical protein